MLCYVHYSSHNYHCHFSLNYFSYYVTLVFVERQEANLIVIQRSKETKLVQIVYKPLKTKCLYYTDTMLGMSHNVFTQKSICAFQTHNLSLTHFFILLWITYRHWLTACWVRRPTRSFFSTVETITHKLENTWNTWRPSSFQIAVGPPKCLVVYYVISHLGDLYRRWVRFSSKLVTS